MTNGIYRITDNGSPIAGLRAEYVADTGESADGFLTLLLGVEGESREYRLLDEDVTPELQAEFDQAVEDGHITDPQADIRRVFLFDNEVELVEAAA